MTITEFLLARIAEDEAEAQACVVEVGPTRAGELYEDGSGLAEADAFPSYPWGVGPSELAYMAGSGHPDRVLVECEAKRRIVEFHQSWPVLVSQPPSFDRVESDDVQGLTVRASQRIAWVTEQEYRAKFGDEPPTAPMLLALASVYADHPDFDPAWRVTD